TGTVLRGVAVTGRRPADRVGRRERVGGAGDVGPVAVLDEIARAGGGPADDEGARDAVRRAGGALAIAHLGHVAIVRAGAADGAAVPRRVLARRMGAVAAIGGARVAVVGAGRPRRRQRVGRAVVAPSIARLGDVAFARGRPAHCRALRVRWAGGVGAVTALAQIARACGQTADGAGGHECAGRAVVVHAVAALGRVAVVDRGSADGPDLRVGRALGAGPGAALGEIAIARGRPAERAGV